MEYHMDSLIYYVYGVFQNSSKVVAVHSEDEEILNKNKKT